MRLATDHDNLALLDLERMCPQGTSLVLQLDRSPDFFLRSRVYENYKVYVAEEKSRILGTIASTIKEFNFGEKRTRGIYIYDLRVYPDCRGKGIGSKLVHHVLDQETGVQIAYGIIRAENYPSLALFKKMGFQNIHDFTMFNIPLYRRKQSTKSEIKAMTAHDVKNVVNLINHYYHNWDFFSSLDANDFLGRVKRLPGYGLEKIHIAEDKGKIVACAGLWNYSEIFRVRALHISTKLKILSHLLGFINIFKSTMRLPSVGEPFRVMYVRDFAFNEKMDLAEELIKHCLYLANTHGCHFLSFILDSDDPAVALLARYKPIKVTYHIYAKSLTNEPLSHSRAAYVDPADL